MITIPKSAFLLLLLFFQGVYSQSTSSGRILGIGIGTFIIIIAVIFSIIWCLACRNSAKPELYSIIGLLVPAVLILAFALTPKQSQKQSTSAITDSNFIPHILFMVFSVVGFIVPGLVLMITDAFAYKKAKYEETKGFKIRE